MNREEMKNASLRVKAQVVKLNIFHIAALGIAVGCETLEAAQTGSMFHAGIAGFCFAMLLLTCINYFFEKILLNKPTL